MAAAVWIMGYLNVCARLIFWARNRKHRARSVAAWATKHDSRLVSQSRCIDRASIGRPEPNCCDGILARRTSGPVCDAQEISKTVEPKWDRPSRLYCALSTMQHDFHQRY